MLHSPPPPPKMASDQLLGIRTRSSNYFIQAQTTYAPPPPHVIPLFPKFRTAALEQHLSTLNAQESFGILSKSRFSFRRPRVGVEALNF